MESRRTPGQRAGLTRAGVLVAARRLLAERGLDALTMRALARALDVAPNTLYSHVASKAALIDEVLDDVLAEVEVPDPAAEDPMVGLRALMASTYDVLLAHPDLVPLYLARQGARGANAQRLGEVMVRQLAAAGVTGAGAREAQRVLIVFTIGFAAFATHPPVEAGAGAVVSPDELRGNLEAGLGLLLAGIAAPPLPRPVVG